MNPRPQYTVANFLADARSTFAPLVTEFAFEEEAWRLAWQRAGKSSTDPETTSIADAGPVLTFRLRDTRVSIAHDPRGEVQVLIRHPHRTPSSVDVEGLARSKGVPDSNHLSGIYSTESTSPRAVLERLARGLFEHGSDLLRAA